MSAKPNYFRLGIFMITAIVILIAAILTFGGGKFFSPKIYIETYIDGSVQGIDVGSPVKFRGVQIGHVTAINFTFNVYGDTQLDEDLNYIIVYMEIDKEMSPGMFDENLTPLLEKNIAQGMRVRIEPMGITGMNYLDIDYLMPTEIERFPMLKTVWLPRNYYIPSAPGELTSMLDSVNSIMHDVEQLNIAGLSKASMEAINNINKAVLDANVGKVSTDAQTLMVDLNASNTELQKILKNIEPATRLDPQKVRSIVNNLATTTENFATFSASIEKRPSLLLYGTPPKPTPTPSPSRRR